MTHAPRLLLADDNLDDLAAIQTLLLQDGYDVTAFADGRLAFEALNSEPFDIVVTELCVREVDGLALIVEAQRLDPRTIAIVVTKHGTLDRAVEALHLGASGFLLKPCKNDEIKLTISRSLEKKRLSDALRSRVDELEEANRTIRSISDQLERQVGETTSQLAGRVQELRQSRQRLDAVIDSMQDGIIVYDTVARVVMANRFMLSLFGLTEAQVLGQMPSEVALLTGESPLDAGPILAGDGAVNIEAEEIATGPPANRHVRRIVSPVRDEHNAQQGLVVVYQDVTERWEVEQMKDDFLSIASHELKTPLTSILGYSQLLNRRIPEGSRDTRTAQILETIEAQSKRMKRLVDDLLDVSRIDRRALAIPCRPVDLVGIAEDVIARQRAICRSSCGKHQFRLRHAQDSVLVWADEGRIDQVLSNLLDNAVKYSPGGGPIELVVDQLQQSAVVAVRDWGIGIPEEQIPKLFDRFYQADDAVRTRRFGGLGLGLFIARGIVEELQGKMTVKSVIGEGSVFSFSIPLHSQTEEYTVNPQ